MSDDKRAKYLVGTPKDISGERKLWLAAKMLRKYFPTDRPVKIQRLHRDKMGGKNAVWGYCILVNHNKSKDRQYFKIVLNKTATYPQQIDTLMHEWAHCLTWYLVENHTDHGDLFHRTFGKIYRFMIED